MDLAYETSTYNELELGPLYDCVYDISLIQYRSKQIKVPFDRQKFNLVLEDYLSGIDRTDSLKESGIYPSIYYSYGINCYDAIIENTSRELLDIRAYHLLYEHKRAFIIRLEYLHQQNYLSNQDYENLLIKCHEMCNLALQLRNLFLKEIRIKKNLNSIDRMISYLAKLKQLDLDFCQKLLSV